jgi:hypothetical protein
MRSSTKRKQVGRPPAPRRRPVLAARVPEEFHAQIVASAAISGRNASEELIWRAQQSYEWEAQFKSHRELLAQVNKAAAANLESMLRGLGYKKVHGIDGYAWFPPGVDAIQWIFATTSPESRVVLQEMFDQAAVRAIERMRDQS